MSQTNKAGLSPQIIVALYLLFPRTVLSLFALSPWGTLCAASRVMNSEHTSRPETWEAAQFVRPPPSRWTHEVVDRR